MTFNSVNFLNNYSMPLQRTGFRAGVNTYGRPIEQPDDTFSTNPIYEGLNTKSGIEAAARSNPRIMQILKENKIPLQVNIKELEDLKRGHLMNSRITVAKMYSALPEELKKEVNLSDLQQAAMLHDYGKVFIPKEILNKNSSFTPQEKQIMDLHSELGYELLKTKGIKPSVLNLVKYHHQTPDGSGYPNIDNDFEYNTELAMLAAADKYSALTEHRSYKSAMPKGEALKIIKEDADNGLLSENIYNALEKAVA